MKEPCKRETCEHSDQMSCKDCRLVAINVQRLKYEEDTKALTAERDDLKEQVEKFQENMTLICEGCNVEFEHDNKLKRLCYNCLDKKLNEIVKERDELKTGMSRFVKANTELASLNFDINEELSVTKRALSRLVDVFDSEECPMGEYRGVSQCTHYSGKCNDKQHLQCIYDHFIDQAKEKR